MYLKSQSIRYKNVYNELDHLYSSKNYKVIFTSQETILKIFYITHFEKNQGNRYNIKIMKSTKTSTNERLSASCDTICKTPRGYY